ncbi:MAG: AsmA family protein [Bacteroidales bacterium]|nr:AsmA family protein [Bacteroidales bacterium]
MKKLLKIFMYLVIVVITLVIVLVITAKLAENKITDIALKKVSESIEAPVIIDNVSFTLLRNFPFATIELNEVYLGSPKKQKDFDNVSIEQDTIINISKIYVSVKSKPLLKGIVEIMKVDIDGANINYFVDTSGASNFDFLMDTTEIVEVDTISAEPLNLTLSDISFKNIVCNFSDNSLKTAAKIIIPDVKVKAKLDGEHISASVTGAINLTDVSFEETNLDLMNNTDVKFDVDYEDDSVSIKQFVVDTDGARLNLLGTVLLGEVIKTDLRFEGSDLIVNELIKYAPKEMLKEFGINTVSGKMNMDATVKGIVSESELPKVDLNVNFQNGRIVTKDYPELKNISFKGQITNGILRNNKSTQVDFSSFHFETEQSKFDVIFSVIDIDHPKYNVKSNMEINVAEFSDFIPDSTVQYIDGKIIASISTKGEVPDSIGDDFIDYVMANSRANIKLTDFNVDVDTSLTIKNFSSELAYKPNNFRINNLSISIPDYKVNLKNTSLDAHFKGSINNTSEMSLDLKSYHLETESSEFSGFAKVKNFDHPTYSFTSNIKLNLDEIFTMLPDSIVNSLTGNVSANIRSSGTLNLDSIADQAMGIVFNSSEFKLNFDSISVEMPDDSLYKIENFSGLVNMSPSAITVNKMSGIAGGIEFEIDKTRIENIYNSVILNNKEQLFVDTRLSLGDLDYNMFAPFMETDSLLLDSTQNKTYAEVDSISEPINYTMLIKGVAKVKSLTYDKVLIEDISTLFNVQDSVYILDQFKLSAFEGDMNTSVKYTLKPENKSSIEMYNVVESMDVKKLLQDFDDFEDFYEPSISHENLSGLFSIDMYSRFVLIGDSLVEKDMRVKGDFKIEDGGVYNYEPATSLSKFTGINELDNIKFKTLNSDIFISKGAIYVPETYISSTALDITAYGMQSFGEDYEYHLQIQLSEILFGKSKKELKKQKKAGDEVTDIEGGTREIIVYSLNGKSKNGFDNKSLQKSMASKIKMQEKMLKFRFDPRLFNFDTKVNSKIK